VIAVTTPDTSVTAETLPEAINQTAFIPPMLSLQSSVYPCVKAHGIFLEFNLFLK
jgi:hypothetical protein